MPSVPAGLPAMRGVPATPTKEEKAIYLEGRKRFLQLYIQAQSGRFTQAQLAQLEDEASASFHHYGERMWRRTQSCDDPVLHGIFQDFTVQQLVRFGQATQQIADTTGRVMHGLIDQPVEAPEEQPSVIDRLLRGG